MYSLLIAVIYLIFISLGLPDSLLGAAWPTMRLAFDMPVYGAGLISMIISCGTIISSVFSERMTKRTSTRFVTVVSVALTAISLMGFSFSSAYWMLCVWAVPYGLGAGAIDSAINNYVALNYSAKHMSWLHCFWGVGTIISPYVMSLALKHATWNAGYRAVSIIQFCILAILIATLGVWKRGQAAEAVDEEQSKRPLKITQILRIKGAPYLFLGFFSYCAAESTAMLWASSFLVETRGVDEKTAAAFASLFFIGITAGRFISGFISERLGDRNMIRIGTAIAALGVVCVIIPLENDILALAGLIIIGVGCAPVYPSIIHSTPACFGREKSQAIIGLQMASAYLGTTLMPPLFGLISGGVGLWLFPFYLAFFFVLMISMLEKAYKTVKRAE